MPTVAVEPTAASEIIRDKCPGSVTVTPLKVRITSPGRMPDLKADAARPIRITTSPSVPVTPSSRASAGVSG